MPLNKLVFFNIIKDSGWTLIAAGGLTTLDAWRGQVSNPSCQESIGLGCRLSVLFTSSVL